MEYYNNFSHLKNTKIFLFLAVAFSFISFNAIAKDINLPATTSLTAESKDTTTSSPNVTTTSSPLSTSTASEELEFCPISFISEGDQHQQNLLKEFRDEVLANHKKGIIYTRLYYIHSPEITLILLSHNDIRTHAKKIIAELIPVATALLKKGTAEMSQQLINDIDALLNEIAHKASSQLREVIRMAKSDIIKKEIFKELGIKITK